MSYLYMSNQRRPAACDVTERSNNRSFSNPFRGFQEDRPRPRPEYHNQHAYRSERRGIVGHDATIDGQYNQAYHQMPSARPMDPQHGPRTERFDFGHQQHYSDYTDDSEVSSAAAVVGSQAPQSLFAPSQPYHDSHATSRAGNPYIQPARSPLQHESSMNHGVPHGWTTGPAPGPYASQHGGHIQHPMTQGAPFMPNLGFVPTPYNRPQAQPWFDPVQSMHIPHPAMYAPAPGFLPTMGVPNQPLTADVPYATVYQSNHPPLVNNPPGDLSNNAIDQDQYPRANNNNMVTPRPHPPETTGSSRKKRR